MASRAGENHGKLSGRSRTEKLHLGSAAFSEGESIPMRFTCSGENISPPLTWSGVPKAAKSIALICDDPDAPARTWIHWVLFNISPTVEGLPEAVPAKDTLSGGAQQGMNDFGQVGYGGPCPPTGKPHRYFFKVYALDRMLRLKSGAGKKDLEKAMKGHIVAEARFMGKYQAK